MFDPENFMHQEVEGALETNYMPVPEGEYEAYIRDLEAKEVNTKNGPSTCLNLNYAVNDDAVAESMGVETPTVRQTVFLDLGEDGSLLMGNGKNIRLGQVREAVGQNKQGKPWSPAQLEGAGPVSILVSHRHGDDGEVYAQVKRVRALS